MKAIIILMSLVGILIIVQDLQEYAQTHKGPLSHSENPRGFPTRSHFRASSRIIHPSLTEIDTDYETETLDSFFQPVQLASGLSLESSTWITDKLRFEPGFVVKCMTYIENETNVETARILAKLIVENGDADVRSLFKQASIRNLTEADSNKRRIGLTMLMDLSSIQFDQDQAALCQTVGNIARTDVDMQVRLDALLALQVWLHENSSIQSEIADEIIQTIGSSTDRPVRTRGYQALSIQGVIYSSDILEGISNLLQNEPDLKNVDLGLQAMKSAANNAKGFAVEQLERVYLGVSDPEKKLSIARLMLENGEITIDRLKQISSNEPWLIGQLQSRLQATRLEQSDGT
jgi:hypothetical protein